MATLTHDADEDGGVSPDDQLKRNSYDLGVDIELYDAVQRLRFEHPEVGAVVITSGKERIFCAGANIRDRKSTRLNSSHSQISYAVFCLKKKKIITCSAVTVSAESG